MTDFQYIRDLLAKYKDKIGLAERHREILDYRFGGIDKTSHTLEETGKKFGLSKQRIKQIELQALNKIDSLNDN